MNKVRSYAAIPLLFTPNTITQSFWYILIMFSVIRNRRVLKAIPIFANNQKEIVMKKLSIIIIAVSLLIPVGRATQAQTEWTKYAGNPILEPGPPGSWDVNWLLESFVLVDDTIFHMWYGGQDGSEMRIGYATSPDGLEWTKNEDNPVLDLGVSGSWDDSEAGHPSVLYDGTIYHMWYAGHDGLKFRIGYATSPNGLTWTKHDSNPVLDVGTSGRWDDDDVNTPLVLMFDDTTFFMWYGGGDGSKFRIGLATSSDGVEWDKWGTNFVMDIGGGWESNFIFPEAVLLIGDTLSMWYIGIDQAGVCRTGYATSSDGGVVWDKYAENPVLDRGAVGAWDRVTACPGTVLFDGTTYKMWYESFDGSGGGSIGYATAPDSIPTIGVKDEGVIPDRYELSQNYPNPFNPETVISYSIPKTENVSLVVYNLIGEEVARLTDEKQVAGIHTVNWDASYVASGIYFYRLQAGEFVKTRKMVLLK